MFEALAVMAIYFGFVVLCCLPVAILYIFFREPTERFLEKITGGGEQNDD